MISFNVLIPVFNDFISQLGGKNLKGLIISLFAFTALISRPFSGKLADFIGRKKVMYFGAVVGLLVALSYPLAGSVAFFLFLRFTNGFSAGFLPTGATALVTDILPPNKRGSGMGIWGTFISAGIGAGQIFSKYIILGFGDTGLYLFSGLVSIVILILLAQLKETLPNPEKFKFSHLRIKKTEIIETNVIPASIVMTCSAIASGIIFVVPFDMAPALGIDNKGMFFGYYVISTILIRLVSSQLSDKIGRRKTLILGLSFMVVSMFILANTTTPLLFQIGAIVFGISTGISSPTLFAWTADLSPVHRRGIGSGTLFIALELGIIIGSLSTLFTYDNTMQSWPTVFYFGGLFSLIAISYLIWHLQKHPKKD